MDIIATLISEFSLEREQIEKTIALIDEGNTIPFIARYRKEVTGSLDDTQLRELSERLEYLRGLEKRRDEVCRLIAEQEKLTPEIESALDAAKILTEIEDIYRPFKPRRRTRASAAKERGLQPLADLIMQQNDSYYPSIEEQANEFINDELGVEDANAALDGACDIIAETISDNAEFRREIRALTFEYGVLRTRKIKDEDSVYAMYYEFSEKVKTLPPHRILAINRAEKEEFIRVSLDIDSDIPLNYLIHCVVTNNSSAARSYILRAASDGYARLIAPSIEREIRTALFEDASEKAIKLFAENLKNLLMQAPVKGMTALGLDPGYRTGCKLAVVDRTGKVLETGVIYPVKPFEKVAESKRIVINLVEKHDINIIAIGNGTASRESELFIADTIKELAQKNITLKYMIVSEAGASVYSASKLAAEEFPDYDVTERGAISIARRLQDPLAELVKIDLKSIGIGQYQHDMKPARLNEALSGVVENCVNSVGVDLNTASPSLLSYISGITPTAAKNIVKYREANGEFTSRAQLTKVPRIGDKVFEQCAGFLRVTDSEEILDNTGVHPETYDAAEALLVKFEFNEEDVKSGNIGNLRKLAEANGIKKTAAELNIGVPTLLDIISELEKPGRDIRDSLPPPILRDDVMTLEDLTEGMELEGTVRNVTDFGAFVDIGVHQDGLVHLSQLSRKYIKHPSDAVSVGDIVKVRVLSVDLAKKRISLTMKL